MTTLPKRRYDGERVQKIELRYITLGSRGWCILPNTPTHAICGQLLEQFAKSIMSSRPQNFLRFQFRDYIQIIFISVCFRGQWLISFRLLNLVFEHPRSKWWHAVKHGSMNIPYQPLDEQFTATAVFEWTLQTRSLEYRSDLTVCMTSLGLYCLRICSLPCA